VNPEQASKVEDASADPALTRGRPLCSEQHNRQRAERLAGVVGGGTQRKSGSQHGKSITERESLILNATAGERPWWMAEGLIVLSKPGNAGGGKEPWFWVALDEAEERGLVRWA
jgi:hypothetical protein